MSQPIVNRIVTTIVLLLFIAVAPTHAQSQPASAPAGGQVIEGIVVNHLGAGIDGAAIRIESLDAGEDAPPLATTTAGKTGDIRVQLPSRIEATVRARVTKEGYATFVQEIDLTDESRPPWIDAALDGAAKLSGIIRDRLFNEPVKNAAVYCETGGQEFTTTTDAQGRYSFNTIAYGPVSIRVTAKGFGTQQKSIRVLSEESEADFKLGPQRKIELKFITDDEKPAPDVNVEAIPMPDNGYVTATTGPDGKVVLDCIGEEAEVLLLRANGPRYVQMRGFDTRLELIEQTAKSNDSPPPTSMPAIRHELTMHLAAGLKGKVIDDKTNQPIVGVRVIVGREFRNDAPMTWTALDGTYELTGLPPGLNSVSFQHAKYATAVQEIHLDQEKVATSDLRMTTGQTVAGKVVDKAGRPIDEVYISADEWQGHSTLGLRGITDKEGAFAFTNAPIGDIVFSFVKPGCGQPLQQTLKSGKDDYKIVLELAEPGADAPPLAPRAPKIELGKLAPEMTLTTLDGATYKLSEMHGKYVMLDFWATWCGPCMAEVDNVKTLRTAMKDRADFVLIGVSLDTDREALKSTIQDKDMDWPQVCGPRSGAREAFETLNGFAIPYTALIGPDGTLLAQDLRGDTLVEQVKSAMTKPSTTKPAP